MKGKIVFVIGGASCGKSRFSCELAKNWGNDVAYIATAIPLDNEMKEKIKEHRKKRPSEWKTIEEPYNLGRIFPKIKDRKVVVVDCLTVYISNLLLKGYEKDGILRKIKNFLLRLKEEKKMAVVVSNEVGCGIVPENPLARKFREIAGCVNQLTQQMSDEVYLMVAGREIKIK